ncbi:hypothetical protein ELI30_27785 (plasmid) [Rhizobium leguminosarum]|uniref:hypothetical protein n=1 Tax=Rhizobium TaxID=379 RepID=UPI00102F74BD|nr:MULTISPECIES: hypothetical protein [Rhizobium]TAV45448.1 hypothetical protein ELI31_26705 [Rhizobium leguminosarum]TAV46005.1 hypothetical protein ELI32_28015 [Rhizobium leguminosarum]TAV63860.1 hypothetical protein ELI30_27785 [Rhizobium leguminosarum]TAX05515.1 hypothetical protein ELI07_24910 [Rhizobium leguminosarum]TAX87629.1 hypothetical protein ELH97_24630 [Rhizobium leguminosarum]
MPTKVDFGFFLLVLIGRLLVIDGFDEGAFVGRPLVMRILAIFEQRRAVGNGKPYGVWKSEIWRPVIADEVFRDKAAQPTVSLTFVWHYAIL